MLKIIKYKTPLLKKTVLQSNFQHIRDQFVVAPIDKANGHLASGCKRVYIEVLMNELEIVPDDMVSNSDT